MAKIPKIGSPDAPAFQPAFRPTPDTQVEQAANRLGGQIENTARQLSVQELRQVRFDSVIQSREEKANRNQILRKNLLGLGESTFAINNSLLDDTEPETLVPRTEKAITQAIDKHSDRITNLEDQSTFKLRAQAAGQSTINNARRISRAKITDSALNDGLALQDQTLRTFSENPNISDEEFAQGVQAIDEYYSGLVDDGLLKREVKSRITSKFDDKLGGVVREQDETLAIESGSHAQLLSHLVRVQSGFYRIAPEDVPGVIEQAIQRQSTFLNNIDTRAAKVAVQREKDFNIAMDLQDNEVVSQLLGRPVSEVEVEKNMRGLVIEAFRKGVVNNPDSVNAVEAEIEEGNKAFLDNSKALTTEALLKATTVQEVNAIIDGLISPRGKAIFADALNGPATRRELLKEAGAKLDKLQTSGASDGDQTLKKEIQLAEQTLNSMKTVGFLNLGTRAENQRIAFLKQILHLRVKQGQKPFDVAADLVKQFSQTPGKAAQGTTPEDQLGRIPFKSRIMSLQATAPLTANEFDDQELRELTRFRSDFINKTQAIVDRGSAQKAIDEEERLKRELEEQNGFFQQFFDGLIPE